MTDADEWTYEDSERVAEAVQPVVVDILRLDRVDLEAARRELEQYEAAGPLLDPTGWRDGKGEANELAIERLDALIECYDRLLTAGGGKDDLDPEDADVLGDSQADILYPEPPECGVGTQDHD